jgi:glucan 1,3-beta-glucosidase
VKRTLDTLRFIAREIGGMVDVIELMNEAAGFLSGETAAIIKQFWMDGYAAVRESGGGGIKIMIGDAFLTVGVRFPPP